MKHSVLIVDDERITCKHLTRIFGSEGYETETANTGEEGLRIVAEKPVSLIVVDLKMPGMDGLSVLKEVKLKYPELPMVVMTAHGTIETAVKAMKLGASDYLTKPFSSEEIVIVAERAIEREALRSEIAQLRKEILKEYSFDKIISKDKKMHEIFELISAVAATDATVLINGETGTGKELVASALHYNSPRRNKRFVSINCGAITETLLESELFGHEKGAFTGAIRQKRGRFEVAHEGSLLLDEIGNVSEAMQIKLLRVLEEREFERVGGTDSIKVDVRIIAATNRDLVALVEEGTFREDLYYRINVVPVNIPPLRDRKGDIHLLASHFLDRFSQKFQRPMGGFSPKALRKMLDYPWPGNVRELENIVERAVLLSKESLIADVDLNEDQQIKQPVAGMTLERWLAVNEENYLVDLLDRHDGNVNNAAGEADMSSKTLYRRLALYGIKPGRKD